MTIHLIITLKDSIRFVSGIWTFDAPTRNRWIRFPKAYNWRASSERLHNTRTWLWRIDNTWKYRDHNNRCVFTCHSIYIAPLSLCLILSVACGIFVILHCRYLYECTLLDIGVIFTFDICMMRTEYISSTEHAYFSICFRFVVTNSNWFQKKKFSECISKRVKRQRNKSWPHIYLQFHLSEFCISFRICIVYIIIFCISIEAIRFIYCTCLRLKWKKRSFVLSP